MGHGVGVLPIADPTTVKVEQGRGDLLVGICDWDRTVANAVAAAVSVALSQRGAATGVTQYWQELVRIATRRGSASSVSRLTGGKRESIRLGRDAFGRRLREMPAGC